MRKRKFGRLAAWLLPLALAALLTCMPNAGMRAGAVEWTGIHSYEQLEAALSDQSGANYVLAFDSVTRVTVAHHSDDGAVLFCDFYFGHLSRP